MRPRTFRFWHWRIVFVLLRADGHGELKVTDPSGLVITDYFDDRLDK